MKHRFEVLDIFRGIFSCLVIIYHCRVIFSKSFIVNNSFIPNADLFVDFFFVLSGFVISYNYSVIHNFKGFRDFIAKRFRRLYPLHLIALIVFALYVVIRQLSGNPIHSGNPNQYSVKEFLYSALLLNAVFRSSLSWNAPSWSISAEMIAYFTFGFVSIFISTLQIKSYITLIAIIIASSVLLYLKDHHLFIFYTYDLGFLRAILGFFSGSLIYLLFAFASNIQPKHSLLFHFMEPILIASVFFAVWFGKDLKRFGMIYEVIFAATIFLFSFERGFISALLKKVFFLKTLGKLSYSTYMNHMFIITLFAVFYNKYTYIRYIDTIMILSVLLSTIIISSWTYNNIELRFMKKKKPHLKRTILIEHHG